MVKEYMVVGFGTSKKDNSPYSRAYRMRIGKDGNWGFLDSKDVYYSEKIKALGEVIMVEQLEA